MNPDTPESHALRAKKQPVLKSKKKTPPPHEEEDGRHYFSFPLYTLSMTGERVLVGGGGGSAATGVANMWAEFHWNSLLNKLEKVRVVSHGDHIVTNAVLSPTDEDCVFIGRGLDTIMLRSGDQSSALVVDSEPRVDDDSEQKTICLDASGKLFAVGGTGGDVRLYTVDKSSLNLVRTLVLGVPVTKIFLRNGLVVAIGAHQAKVWREETLLATLNASDVATGAQWRGGGLTRDSKLILGSFVRNVKSKSIMSHLAIFDISRKSVELKASVQSSQEPQTCVVLSADDSLVACGSSEGSVSIFSLRAKGKIQWLMNSQPHTFFVSGLCFSPDGSHVLSCSGDKSLVIQPVVQQQHLRHLLALFSLLVLLVAILFKYVF